jgi:hypothetical protein
VEVFSAGCAACNEVVETIKRAACPSCEVIAHDMKDVNVARRAKALASARCSVVIDGKLADCCAGRGFDESVLRAAGDAAMLTSVSLRARLHKPTPRSILDAWLLTHLRS